MSPRRLLAVLAHPDDESFGPGGTLAKYAREGAEVHVCIVTDGASGSTVPDTALAEEGETLADLRRRELACACQVLSVQLHTLDYRDSGMEGAPDNKHPRSLYQADLADVATHLLRVIGETRPHVVVTHDPSGGYFHPDHIRVNHAVRRAWAMLQDAESAPRRAVTDGSLWQPQKLYYSVVGRSSLRWYVWLLRLSGRDPRRYGRRGDVDLTQVGVPDRSIHVRIDVWPYLDIKQRAAACHLSQGGGSARWRSGPRWLRNRALRYEYFVQAYPAGARRHRDLFQNVAGTG